MNKTFVQIETGIRVKAAYVTSEKFWEAGDLRRDGTPDRRKLGHRFGVTRLSNGTAHGHFVPLNEETEQLADLHRARIAKLKAELDAAKAALRSYYLDRQNGTIPDADSEAGRELRRLRNEAVVDYDGLT